MRCTLSTAYVGSSVTQAGLALLLAISAWPAVCLTPCAAPEASLVSTAAAVPASTYSYPPPQPNALAWRPYPGLLNTWLRQQSPEFNKWNIGAWERFRYESRNYFAANGAGPLAVDFNAASPTAHNNYSLFRTQVWVGYAPTEWIRGFVEAQDSSQNGWEGDPNPQANNALVFPGLGLGVAVCGATRVTDRMIAAAAQAVASMVGIRGAGAPLLPRISDLRRVSATVAIAVAKAAADDGVAAIELENPVQDVFERMWQPVYPELVLDAEESADGE